MVGTQNNDVALDVSPCGNLPMAVTSAFTPSAHFTRGVIYAHNVPVVQPAALGPHPMMLLAKSVIPFFVLVPTFVSTRTGTSIYFTSSAYLAHTPQYTP